MGFLLEGVLTTVLPYILIEITQVGANGDHISVVYGLKLPVGKEERNALGPEGLL
jgi:hypothetical protein